MQGYKKHLKNGIKLILDSNGNPLTLVIIVSKKQVMGILDQLLPDDPDVGG